MYICTRCADLLCTEPTIHLMVAFLKILLQSIPLLVASMQCATVHILASLFKESKGRLRITVGFQRTSIDLLKTHLSITQFQQITVYTGQGAWQESTNDDVKINIQLQSHSCCLINQRWSHCWAFERLLLNYWSTRPLKSGHKKWEKKVNNNGYVWTRLTHSLPFTYTHNFHQLTIANVASNDYVKFITTKNCIAEQ